MTAYRYFFVHKEVPTLRYTFLAMTLDAAWAKVARCYRQSALKFSRKDFTVTIEPEVLGQDVQTVAQRIEAIVAAARKPLDTVVPVLREKHKVTGKMYSVFGMPFNFKAEDYETVTIGYALRDDKSGVMYGVVEPTEQAVRDRQAARQAHNDAEFRATLQAMSPKQLEAQEKYWIKENAA